MTAVDQGEAHPPLMLFLDLGSLFLLGILLRPLVPDHQVAAERWPPVFAVRQEWREA